MNYNKIKAVIPAAGFGTRFLPLTKAQPKEMLPVVNKPTIQWVIEEAVDAGITDIAIITGKHKKAIENHFKPIKNLEKSLEESGRLKELEELRKVHEIANLEFIIQEEQKGLGHAILCAEDFVGRDSFAILLGDTICTGNPNCTRGLVDLFFAIWLYFWSKPHGGKLEQCQQLFRQNPVLTTTKATTTMTRAYFRANWIMG